MIRKESDLRNLIANRLKCEDYQVKIEARLSKGYRVDILAEKDNIVRAIEVKITQRGIADDISKCYKLLPLPEPTEVYVAAPKLIISPDHVAFATRVGVGLLAITESGLDWMLPSHRLEPPMLSGSASQPSRIQPGRTFEVVKTIYNRGQKVACNLEAHCVTGGPFVVPAGAKRSFNRHYLDPNEEWQIMFTIKAKPRTKPGNYPLLITLNADNAKRDDTCFDILVSLPEHGVI